MNRMKTPYPVPMKKVRAEVLISNSRFIASLSPAFTVEEARDFIKLVKVEFKDATHHVPVFLIGHGVSVTAHCSDAGEPAGTAGRPAMAVLQGSGLGDVVVVVTRYFGGTKLGTGGLARAYSDAVKAVLSNVERGIRIMTDTVMTAFAYTYLERARKIVLECGGTIQGEDFGVDVTINACFPVEKTESFRREIAELTGGKVEVEVIDTSLMLFHNDDVK